MRIRIHLLISRRIQSRLFTLMRIRIRNSAPHHSDEDQLHFADPDLAFTVMGTRFQHPKINPDPCGSGSATNGIYECLYIVLLRTVHYAVKDKECIDLRGDLVQYAFMDLT
jgi:hypothetical protein